MLQIWIRSYIFLSFLVPGFCTIFPQNRNPFVLSIPEILKGVKNCDIRIFWDDLQDFQYDINSCDSYLPTISVFAPGYFNKYTFSKWVGYQLLDPKKAQFALNIHQTRIQTCMINLLLIGNETLVQTSTHNNKNEYIEQRDISISLYFTMAYNNYLQFSSDRSRWCESLSNIYTILLTNFTKLIKQKKIKLLACYMQYVEYFAIIIPTELNNSKDLKICVAERTLEADLSKTICEDLNAERSVIEFVNEKWMYSPYWYSYGINQEEEDDPFDRFSNTSIDFYIFLLAARRENKNITIYTMSSISTLPDGMYSTFSTIYWVDFRHKDTKTYGIFVQSTGLKWLTCYKQTYIGFGFYLSPFEPNLWIGFLITMSAVVGISWIYTKFYFKDSSSMSFSPWLFVLGTIFEETSSAPAKIEKKTFYRLSIGLWCLMVAILTNCYNGLMITDLNSPLPGIKIESFKDLLCDKSLIEKKPNFSISQWFETSKISWYWDKFIVYKTLSQNAAVTNPYELRSCFRIWSPTPYNLLISELQNKYYNVQNMIQKNDSFSYSDRIISSLFHPGHAREPEMLTKIRNKENRQPTVSEQNTANQLEITNCAQKSAYIANSQEIAMELDFLSRNYNSKRFYVGKDRIEEKFEGFKFEKVRNTKIPGYYRLLIDTGIYGRLMAEKVGREKLSRENTFQKPVNKNENLRLEGVSSLEGGLVTLFILCGAVISLAVITFCLECRRIIWGNLVNGFKRVLKALKMLTRKRKDIKFKRHRKIHVEIGMIEVKPKK